MPRMERSWEGIPLQARIDRANVRATISLAVHAAMATKEITHVISGTLKRSVHAAPVGYDAEESDLANAEPVERGGLGQDLMPMFMGTEIVAVSPMGAMVEVGSWLPYACAEWVGRGHPGVTQGMEMIRGALAYSIVFKAYKEEGLV